MENQAHYEVYHSGPEELGIRVLDGKGRILQELGDLSGRPEYVQNLAALYNENHLMPEHFSSLTEGLIGILL